MLRNARVPVVGLAAWSGTGKTTLLRALVPLLKAHGLRVGLVKHAHHAFDVDKPGKDSYELRKAGADRVLVASRVRWALVVERALEREPTLDETLRDLDQDEIDVVLVEGFKRERFPKIEVHRPSIGRALLFPDDDSIVAIATDAPLGVETTLPVLDLNAPEAVAAFVAREIAGGAPHAPGAAESA